MAMGPDGNWQMGIGDPTLVGWLTVGAYIGSAALAYRASGRSRETAAMRAMPSEDARALTYFWIAVTLVLSALGINKQLDLQSGLIQIVRDLSREGGWYEARRTLQMLFVISVAITGLASMVYLSYRMRRLLTRVGLAVLGLTLLVVFVIVRAASFHHVDVLLSTNFLNQKLELTGIALVALSAWWQGRAAARPPALTVSESLDGSDGSRRPALHRKSARSE